MHRCAVADGTVVGAGLRQSGRPADAPGRILPAVSAEAHRTEPHRSTPAPTGPVRQRLRSALTAAMRRRDRVAVSALRSGLAAIDNAEAVDRPADVNGSLAIEQIAVGLGANEVGRRLLTEAEMAAIVGAEATDRDAAAGDYDRLGQPDRAAQLRAEAAVLRSHLTPG